MAIPEILIIFAQIKPCHWQMAPHSVNIKTKI